LRTGLHLGSKNGTMTSRKWKGSYDCGRKYKSECERLSRVNVRETAPKGWYLTNHKKSEKHQ